jgi:hypothetical protein
MKFVFALVAALVCTAASGQTQPRSAMGEMLLAPKKSPLSLELYRATHVCAGLRDCDASMQPDASRLGFSPCATDPLSCHLAADTRSMRPASFGGFKFSGTIGDVTISLGRHGDIPLLAHSPVLEGAYRLGPGFEAHFGIVRHTDESGAHHPMEFLLFRKEL